MKKIEIRKVADYNDHSKERLILDVNESTDIGDYLVLDTTYTRDGKISNHVRHPYWFPDQKVKKGDRVVLYTRTGTNSTNPQADGSTVYFYYWGLKSSVWNDTGDCAVLLHVDEWSHKKANQ